MLFPIPDPKEHPLPEMPNTTKRSMLKCLKTAKELLLLGTERYLCVAIEASEAAPKTQALCEAWVLSQLEGHHTYGAWAGTVSPEIAKYLTTDVRHACRIKWVSDLIDYLETQDGS